MHRLIRRALAPAALASLLLAAAAPAQPAPEPYGTNDFGGFHDVLPPGTNGTVNALQLAAFLANGARPLHNDDQLGMYADLVFKAPGLQPTQVEDFFKDSTFGVREGQVARRYSPRSDVTVIRDAAHGVPHVYGSTRDGAMFGLGYVAAEDRLFLMDLLRNVGRARLSSYAGGAQGNRDFDRDQWAVAPYTEEDLQRQVDQFDDLLGPDGAIIQRDSANYVAGVNAYIQEAQADPTKLPGEYAAINRPQGPDPWNPRDIIATAALVGGIFGKGGGGEIGHAQMLQALRKRFGRRRGDVLYRDLRGVEEPEAPTTVHRRRFPYQRPARRERGVALPDEGSVKREPIVVSAEGAGTRRAARLEGILGGPDALPDANSNALLVSGRESQSGHPLAVMGPQTGYFTPQLLMEQDVHAPPSEAGPGIDARGAAFAGTNLYVQLGHGRDYAWSATSAGQDMIDTYAVDLCEPDGSKPTLESDHYRFRGQCVAMEVLRRSNSWEPTAADSTPAGGETLIRKRTKLGLVVARATLRGRPIAFTELRSTYFHEIDSAPGFLDFNTPERMRSAEDFQRAANRILYTFNWFYADDRDIAYFNSGANPVRPRGVVGDLPTLARKAYEWRGFDPERNLARFTPFEQHPQVVNQQFLTSWNNHQALEYGFGNGTSLYRSRPLDDRIRRGIEGDRKMTLVELIDAMEDAGTVDLRGSHVLPWALKVIARAEGEPALDAELAAAVEKLRAWAASGAHRRDGDRDEVYDDRDAIRLMDAWWPRMFRAVFEPVLGKEVLDFLGAPDFDDANRRHHLGSAFQGDSYGYLHKDLRTVLGRRVRGRYSRVFCGRGSLRRCRRALLASLREAMTVPDSQLYEDDICAGEGRPNDQYCADAVRHTPVGAVTQPMFHWINRPTYQQALEIQGHRPR